MSNPPGSLNGGQKNHSYRCTPFVLYFVCCSLIELWPHSTKLGGWLLGLCLAANDMR